MDGHHDTGGALRAVLDRAGTPSVPEGLLDEALARGGRLRRRRMMARGAAGTLGAAALVAGLVVTVPALGAGPDRTAPPAASGARSTPTPSASPSGGEGAAVQALFPDEDDLRGLRYRGGPMTGPDQPAVLGPQICDSTVVGPARGAVDPVDVATMGAVLPEVTEEGVDDASFTVAAWTDSRGWQQLVADTGPCRWIGVEQVPWPGGDRPDRLLLVGRDDPRWVVAVRRVGTRSVAVSIHRSGTTDPTVEAVRLVGLMATRLEDSPWPAVGP
ncbi:hypothetical protein [Phycicoccus avicenniae]|uniref:hypothetical protein n=1 Tax=Phycicoccus avicenniae TaxID=2828860 RepID=UPI003D2A1D15